VNRTFSGRPHELRDALHNSVPHATNAIGVGRLLVPAIREFMADAAH
jgi:hypothetical protein